MKHLGEARTVLRARIEVRGAVQGVGFRPHVFRLATELGLSGFVSNDARGVSIDIEGERGALERFRGRLIGERPPAALIESVEMADAAPQGFVGFEIGASAGGGVRSALILPDLALCPDCLREMLDPDDRRHRYPFINCVNCGPRFSIVESLPYDRCNTSMTGFSMCPSCRDEYEDPRDRRFHAQPIACPQCGPRLSFHDGSGTWICDGDAALWALASAIRGGQVAALKGLGGFQLLVDASNAAAVRRLRRRKGRGEKPFALMCSGVGQARRLCRVSAGERRLLESSAAPIVLLRKRDRSMESVAPGIGELGLMLPYTPLHHLLMGELAGPVVATSGNRSEEPICIGNREALGHLAGLADCFLLHDRPILRRVDDSVARVVCGQEQVLRRARGYAPLPLRLSRSFAQPTLAYGAHLKNTVALGFDDRIFASQHIGDLDTEEALQAFRRSVEDLPRLYKKGPEVAVHDRHPDYASTVAARASGQRCVAVPHHLAHVYACMADHRLVGPVFGVSWDGVGLGDDGGVWGGEFFVVSRQSARRVASLLSFPLIGGDAAAREPRRCALGMLLRLEEFDAALLEGLPLGTAFSQEERTAFVRMAERGLNTPDTTSMGRLFDGMAALLGIRLTTDFEGQAAMLLEAAALGSGEEGGYPFGILDRKDGLWEVDWRPAVRAALADRARGVAVGLVSRRFHQMLSAAIVALARRAGIREVLLSGGCFQNRLLTELAVAALREANFRPRIHRQVPPNDGGIAVGQLYAQCV